MAKGYLLGICPFLHYQGLFHFSTDPVFNFYALSKRFSYVLSYIRHHQALSAHVMENKIKSHYVVCLSHDQISVSFPVSLTTVFPRSNWSLVSQRPLQHPFYLSGNTNSLVLFHVTWQFFLFKTSGHHLFLVFSVLFLVFHIYLWRLSSSLWAWFNHTFFLYLRHIYLRRHLYLLKRDITFFFLKNGHFSVLSLASSILIV